MMMMGEMGDAMVMGDGLSERDRRVCDAKFSILRGIFSYRLM